MQTTSSDKTEKRSIGKSKIVLVSLLGLLAIGLAWVAYLYVSVRPWLNFQQYIPTYLVDGRHILDDQRLTLYADNQLFWFRPKSVGVQVGLSGYNLSSWIFENKVDPTAQKICGAGTNCIEKTTQQGQKYQIIQMDSFTREILFTKGHTSIGVKIYGKNIPSIPDEEWSRMIDSFQQKSFDRLRMNHAYPGP